MGYSTPEENLAWAYEEALPFEIWTDDTHALSMGYGVATAESTQPARVTLIFDAGGTLLLEYRTDILAGTPASEVLHDLYLLFPEG